MKVHAYLGKQSRRGFVAAVAMAGMLALAGCATSSAPRPVYGTQYGNGYGGSQVCQQCGVVQSVETVDVDGRDSSHVLGTIIGAVVGGAVGNQVGGGSGKTLATVAGAAAGGAVGHHVAKAEDTAYRIVVRLDDGQYATVTQRGNPNVRPGERVQIRNNKVYALR